MREIDIQAFERFLFLKRGRSEGGIRTALNHLQAISGWFEQNGKELNGLGVEEFFIAKKREGLTNGTLGSYRTIFSLLEKFLGISLLGDIRLPDPIRKIPNILTTDEVKRLLAVNLTYGDYGGVSCERLNTVYKTITELLYFTGCRIEEALALTKKQLLSDSLVHFVKTKFCEERMVFVYPPCHKHLLKLVEGQDIDALVFRNMKGKKIHGVDYRKVLKRMACEVGIDKKIFPHLLRHTLASHLSQIGADVRVVQKILGHKSLDSTIYYEQFNVDRQVDVIFSLSLAQPFLTPEDRIKRVKKDIEKHGYQNDKRFDYRLEETTRYGKKGLILELFEK